MKPIVTEYYNEAKQNETFSTCWWTQDEKEVFRHIWQTVSMLETRQSYRSLENVKHARLYANLEVLGIYSGLYSGSASEAVLQNRVSLNVIKACVDTATNKIAKAKPRPIFLTEGGNYEQQRKAKMLNSFIDGMFQQMNIYEEKQKSFTDAAVFGTGAVKFYKDTFKKKVCCERVIIEELLIDDAEGIYAKPQTLYQRRLVSKEVLKNIFPQKYHDAIDRSGTGLRVGSFSSDRLKDMVRVIEAWHLPSVHGATDGKHALIIEDATLVFEDYKQDWFPFVFDRWSHRLLGFWGMGIAEELTGIQIEINKILRNIQLAMHLQAVPRVLVENSSQVNLNALNNDIASIVRWSGAVPPQFITPAAMSPDVYAHLSSLYQRAFEIVGISQLSAQSKKPSGLDSGRALREFQDIESERFQVTGQRYEQSFLESAKIVIEMTKELDQQIEGGVKVKVAQDGEMKVVKWRDIDLDDDQFVMKVFPASLLPTQPTAKLQTVVEMIQAGFYDKETGMDLLDFPDIQSANSMMLAPRKIVLKILNKMLEDGVYESPEPYMNLSLAQSLAQQKYLEAKLTGVPEDKLELMRRFIDDCQGLLMLAQQGAVEAQQMAAPQSAPVEQIAPMEPIANPEAAPTSELLPIA